MQRDKVMIVCDVCGAEFSVDKSDALSYRYTLPVRSSLDVTPNVSRIVNAQLDLCAACQSMAATICEVVETRERGTNDQGTIHERTGRKLYDFM